MNKSLFGAAAALSLCFAAGTAAAQGLSINERQAAMNQRIESGIRTGDLTRAEALQLRTEFRDLEALESRYRANGLTAWERGDLEARFKTLSHKIIDERHDRQTRNWYGGRDWTDNRGRWVAINLRQAQLDQRIDQGVRSRQLTPAEATRLRAEFREIARVEARYRRDGLTMRERADLDRRFDQLAMQIRFERRDDQRRYSAG